MRFASSILVVGLLAPWVLNGCTGGNRGPDDWGDAGHSPTSSISNGVGPDDSSLGGRAEAGVSGSGDSGKDTGSSTTTAPLTPDAPVLADARPPALADAGPPALAGDGPVTGNGDVGTSLPPDVLDPAAVCAADHAAAVKRGTNMAANWDFASTATSWTPEFATTQVWNMKDASGTAASGSLAISYNNVDFGGSTRQVQGGSRQCVAVAGGSSYGFYARQFIGAGQSTGRAGVAVLFYAGADCTGAPTGNSTTPFPAIIDKWTLQCGATVAPAGSKSMAVRLVVQKSHSQPSVTVLFDDVLVVAQ